MNRGSFLFLSALAPIADFSATDAASMSETLVGWARSIVAEIAPENNAYGSHPTYVEWSDAATGRSARNRSVCSSFASHVLGQSFGYTADDIDTWFEKRVPQAREYHDTIAGGRGFRRIIHVGAIRPGDIIAIAYPDGSHPTGHVMIAEGRALPRMSTPPIEPNTWQFELAVIDSANSGHGRSDTRSRPNGAWTTGVGHGNLRLYAADDDTVAGYAWSTSASSSYRSSKVRRPAIGRLDPSTVPRPSGTPGTSIETPDDRSHSADDAAFDD